MFFNNHCNPLNPLQDKREWVDVIDKSEEQCSSWQHLSFPLTPVSYIRIIGTQVTAAQTLLFSLA